MELKHWDIVISKSMRDHFIEAVVDFVNDDWMAYISEWWKNLNYPTRIVIDEDKLILKDKKIKMTRSEFENIIAEYYWEQIDFFNLKADWAFEFWDIVKIWYSKYMFIDYLWWKKDYRLFCTLNWASKSGNNTIKSLVILSDWDLSSYIRTRWEIINNVFWPKCSIKDLSIVEDIDWTPINIEED